MADPSKAPRNLASSALLCVVIVAFATTLRSAVISSMRRGAVATMRDGGDIDAIRAQLERYAAISLWSHVALMLVIVGAALVLASALRRGRRLAVASAVAAVAHVGCMMVQRSMTFTDGKELSLKLLWWSSDLTLDAAMVLAIAGAAPAVWSATSRWVVMGAGLLAMLSLGYTTYFIFDEKPSTGLQWIGTALGLFVHAGYVACGWVVARQVARGAVVAAPSSARLDGSPLRVLGFALLVRVGLGLLLQIATMVSMADKSLETASVLMMVSTGVSGLVALAVLGALVGYLRYPPSHRGEALPIVMILVVVAVVLDVVASSAATQLFDLAAQARKATSMWGGPSFSEMESLQATLTWCGRLGLVAGVTASVVLASALGTTARAVEDAALTAAAGRVRALALVAGFAALGLMFALGEMRRATLGLVVVAGVLVLMLAIYLIVAWTQLLFGLARAVETASAPPDDARQSG